MSESRATQRGNFAYGLRLWIQSTLLGMAVHGSVFYSRLRSGVDYLVPVPAVLFFDSVGLLDPVARVAGYSLALVGTFLAIAAFTFGPSPTYRLINSITVIVLS